MHAFLLVVGDNVEEQLKPFGGEYAFAARPEVAARKPNEKYDHYQMGGRWKHALELSRNHAVEMQLVAPWIFA